VRWSMPQASWCMLPPSLPGMAVWLTQLQRYCVFLSGYRFTILEDKDKGQDKDSV
jgi:hypothetical protein